MIQSWRYCTRKDHGPNRASQHFGDKQKKGAVRKMGKYAFQGRKEQIKLVDLLKSREINFKKGGSKENTNPTEIR